MPETNGENGSTKGAPFTAGGRLMTQRILVRLLLSAPLSLAPLIYLPILTRTLSKAQYGQWSLALAFAVGISTLATLSLAVAIPRFYAQDKEEGQFASRFWACVFFTFFLSAVAYLLALPFASFLSNLLFGLNGRGHLVMSALALGMLWSQRALLSSLLRARFELVRQSVLELMVTACKTVVIIALSLWGASLTDLLWSQCLIELSACIYLFLAAWRRAPLKVAKFTLPKTYFLYALPLLPAVVLTWLGKNIERFVLVHLQGQAVVGEYTVAVTVGSVLLTVSGAVNYVLLPQLAEAWRGREDKELCAKLFATANRALILLGMPVVVGLALVWGDLVAFLAGPTYKVAWPVAALTALGHLSLAIFTANIYAWHLSLRTKLIPLLLVFSACVDIILALLLIPHLGALGAATAFWAGQTVNASVAIYASRRLSRWRLPFGFFLRTCAACLAMACLVVLAKWLGGFTLWALVAVGVATYALSALTMGLINLELINNFWHGLKQKTR